MSNWNTRRSPLVVAASIALGLTACGGAGSPAAPTAAPDASSNPTIVLSETLPGVQAGTERVLRLSLPRSGTLAITVEWSDPNNSVTAVLTGAGCFDFRNDDADCQVRRSIDGPRREKEDEGRQGFIEFPGADGSYVLTVQNLGPGADSIRVTGVLTSVEATPFPTPPTPRPTDRPDRDRPNPRQSGRP
jgi:hypothetical protein